MFVGWYCNLLYHGQIVLELSWSIVLFRERKAKHGNFELCQLNLWGKVWGQKNECQRMIHTNSAPVLSTLLTKSEYHGTIGIALTINTSLVWKRSAYSVWPFLTIENQPYYACKSLNTKLLCPLLSPWELHKCAKIWSRIIQQGITNDGLHSGCQYQLVVLHRFVWWRLIRVLV